MMIIASCSKNNTSFDYTQAIETTSNYVEAQQMTDLLLNTYFKSITDSILLTDGISNIDGANISYTSTPAKLTIEYPWCTNDGYGHTRVGIYEATSESGFFDSLDIINFEFKNFYYDFDSISVSGFSIVNKGRINNNYLFDIEVNNIYRETIDTATNKTFEMTYKVDQSFTRFKDNSSPYYTQEDYFAISGIITGKDQNGFSYSAVIVDTSLLVNSLSCKWLKQGNVNIELPDFIYNTTTNFSYDTDCKDIYSIIMNETLFTQAFDGGQTDCPSIYTGHN